MTNLATNRRELMALAGAGAVVAACGGAKGDGGEISGDRAMGSVDAPVTIIEYASTTCPHCAAFYNETFPALKERYIDTGKVRFIFRELPTAPAPVAMAGMMLARCAPEERYFDVLDLLFEKQRTLVLAFQSGGPAVQEEFHKIARPLGISDDAFAACVSNNDEIQRIRKVGEDADALYGVSTTPSFVINGETHAGAMSIDQMAALIDPLLPAASGG